MARGEQFGRLFYGDNLDVLRRHVPDASVDLVYLDPPFQSGKSYNVIFEEHGSKASAQIQAFDDTSRPRLRIRRRSSEAVLSP